MSVRAAVVDSSGWIELFTDGPQASRFVALLDSESTLVVPVISILEVFKWVLHEPALLLPLAAALVLAISWRLAWPRRWKLLGLLLVSLTLSCIYSPASTAALEHCPGRRADPPATRSGGLRVGRCPRHRGYVRSPLISPDQTNVCRPPGSGWSAVPPAACTR